MPLRNPDHAYAEYRTELAPGEQFTQYHIKVRAADVARYVLLPGSHVRGRLIAARLEDAQVVGVTRGYHVYTGVYAGTRLSVCSTGMGGPAVAIAMEELGALGADTFIRVDSAGGWHWYLPVEFPAVADHAVVAALLAAAQRLSVPVRHGICATRDALYVPGELFEEGERRPIAVCLDAVVDLCQIDHADHPVEVGAASGGGRARFEPHATR